MSTPLVRARLTPYASDGTTLKTDETVKLDFNPETLTLKVSSAQQQDKARRGRQQVQNTGASSSTLSFDAIFDTTRPKSHDAVQSGDVNDDTALDVRRRTGPIASWLAAFDQPGGGSGGGGSGGKPTKAPNRVRFQWGSIVFDGVITSHQETFDFFSPTGVPLRSKVQLTLTEQNFTYAVSADQLAGATANPAPSNVRAAATAAGANSLFDLGPGGLSLGFSADAGIGLSLDANASLSAQLGISADFGASLDAGLSLDASAALDVFGAGALAAGAGISGGGGDVGQAGLSRLAPTPASPAGSTQPPSSWAPDGPVPGSAAAGLAAAINATRAVGAAVPPPGGPGALASTTPLPVRGSPPPVLPRSPANIDTTVYSSNRLVPRAVLDGDRLPSWQTLPIGALAISPTSMVATRHRTGCGCTRCGGH